MKYLINNRNEPGYNLAFEEYCYKNLPRNEKYFFFWINKPAIIVGKNQNTMEEINYKFVEKENIKVIRRITGGGAVYHDYGNLNFSLITDEDSNSQINFEKYNRSIVKALNNLGVEAELSGRNDILLKGKKVSGIAQSISKRRVLNHGTLMFDVDLKSLEKSLLVRRDKLESKGVKSVRSRVGNIKEYLNGVANIYEFRDRLLKEFFRVEGEELLEYSLSKKDLEAIDQLFKDKYSSWDWNFGKSPASHYKNYKKFKTGGIEIRFDIVGGYLSNLKIYGDFFGRKDLKTLIDLLEGSPYIIKAIEEKLSNVNIEDYFGSIKKEEFIDLMFISEKEE